MKPVLIPGAFLALSALLSGCTLDYGKDDAVDPDKIPLMEFQDLRQTSVRDGRVLYTMETETSKVFQAKKQVVLKNFRFQEYDLDGKPASEGSADSAVVNSNTNDARISGQLKAHSKEWGVTLEVGGTGGGLTWKNDDRILKTEPNTGVTLRKDDGSQMEARSLTLDLGSNRLELEEGVQGTWTPETKNDAITTDGSTTDTPPPASP